MADIYIPSECKFISIEYNGDEWYQSDSDVSQNTDKTCAELAASGENRIRCHQTQWFDDNGGYELVWLCNKQYASSDSAPIIAGSTIGNDLIKEITVDGDTVFKLPQIETPAINITSYDNDSFYLDISNHDDEQVTMHYKVREGSSTGTVVDSGSFSINYWTIEEVHITNLDAGTTYYVTDVYATETYHSDSEKATIKSVTIKETYLVKFMDYDDTVYTTQTVLEGEDADAPTTPPTWPNTGYVFDGWGGSYTNITADTDIYPTWNETQLPLPTFMSSTYETIGDDHIEIRVDNENTANYPDVVTKAEIYLTDGTTDVITFGPHSTNENSYIDFTSLLADERYVIQISNSTTVEGYNNTGTNQGSRTTLKPYPVPSVQDFYFNSPVEVSFKVSNNNTSGEYTGIDTKVYLNNTQEDGGITVITDSDVNELTTVTFDCIPGYTAEFKPRNLFDTPDGESIIEDGNEETFSVPKFPLDNPEFYTAYTTRTENSITVRVANNNNTRYPGDTSNPNVETEVWISSPITTLKKNITTNNDRSDMYFEFTGLDPDTNYTFSARNDSYDISYADSGVVETSIRTLDVFTVKFTDSVLGTIDTQQVVEGENASLPSEPERTGTGYVFDTWSGDHTNITADTTITATWNTTPLPEPIISKLTPSDPTSEIRIKVQNNNTNGYPDVVTRVNGPNGWFTIGTSSSNTTFYKTFTGLDHNTSYGIDAYNRVDAEEGYSNSSQDNVTYSTDEVPRLSTPSISSSSSDTDSVWFTIQNPNGVSVTADYNIYEPSTTGASYGTTIKSGSTTISGNSISTVSAHALNPDTQYAIKEVSLSASGYLDSYNASIEFVSTDPIQYATSWVHYETLDSQPNVDISDTYAATSIQDGGTYLTNTYPPENYEVGTKAGLEVSTNTYYIYEAQ